MDLPQITLVVPFFDEAESARAVVQEALAALRALGRPFEVVLVDDGSRDATFDELRAAAKDEPRACVVRLRRNFGQTAAIAAGVDRARGSTIVLMDGDGQNDPADVGKLLAALEQGADVASGWRRERKDPLLTRRLPSSLANRLISWVSGVRLHDHGCTLKAYRAEVLKGVRLYGEMHRLIPIHAGWRGAKVVEVPVAHRARARGRSKYGLARTGKVLLDLLVAAFLMGYATKPIHFFGGIGLLSFAFATLPAALAVYYKWLAPPLERKTFIETPLPLATVLFLLTGILSLLMGLLAELVMRAWFESGEKPVYVVREVMEGGTKGP